MADFLTKELEALGVTVEQRPLGKQTTDEGKEIDLPPAVLGKLGDDKNKVGFWQRRCLTSWNPTPIDLTACA